MKPWTKQAQDRLAEYLESRATREGLVAGDADEMREDLTAHVYEELEQSEAGTIGTAELEAVLNRLGGISKDGPAEVKPRRGRGWAIFFAVILPAAVSLFEILTGFCGGVFFDPVPTFWHASLVLLVPILNFWLLTKGRSAESRWQGVAAGVAVTVSLIYALLFLPLVPASAIAVIVWGLGLLSLTPLIAWIASMRVAKTSRAVVAQPWRFREGWRMGALAVLLTMLVLEGPAVWTRMQLTRALSENPEVEVAGIERLRGFHSERTLLRACYEGNRGTSMATDIAGWTSKGWNIPAAMLGRSIREHDSELVRDVFFRVTGKSFNAVPPPQMVLEDSLLGGRGRGNMFEEFEFDSHLGGDSVAVRLKDLDLAESRFDGHVDGLSQIGYGEWTMVFNNGSPQAKEARCQVRLPRGGRVSRLTLWVNGEPREAAFNSVEKVKAAYKEIAVVQRRDPVLVTMAGPDTVMVQCFPVPAHGEMKIRFGVTAPMDGLRWEMPRIVERNFGVTKAAEHALWVQSDRAFEIRGLSGVAGSMKDGDGFSTNAVIDFDKTLDGPMAVVLGELDEEPKTVWCEDQFADADGKYLERKSRMGMRRAVDRLVVVVDGSASMEDQAGRLRRVLGKCPDITLLIANDSGKESSVDELGDYRFSGGRDNEPALREAVSLAKEGQNGAVVWLHGPQAVKLTRSEALLQLLERGTRQPKIYEVEMVAGPNRLSEELGKAGVLERGPTMFDVKEDLGGFIRELLEGGPEARPEWRRAAAPEEFEGEKVWNHLARMWAIERSESDDPKRARIAATYQLVTPVSGAVVLETMEQFEKHGLKPVDADAAPSIPSVPEPSTSLLVLIAACAGLMRRRRGA